MQLDTPCLASVARSNECLAFSSSFDDQSGSERWYWSVPDLSTVVVSNDPFSLTRSRKVCAEAVRNYLAIRDAASLDDTRTFIEGVHALPPGRKFIIGPSHPHGQLEQPDWSRWPRSSVRDAGEAARAVDQALTAVVTEVLSTHAMVGRRRAAVTVSGGLDSSYVAAAAMAWSQQSGNDVTLCRGANSFSSPTELQHIGLLERVFNNDVLHLDEIGVDRRQYLAQQFLDVNHGEPAPVGNLALAIYVDMINLIKERTNGSSPFVLNGEGGDDLFDPGSQVVASAIPLEKRLSAVMSDLNNQSGYRNAVRDAVRSLSFSTNSRFVHRRAVSRSSAERNLDVLAFGANYALDIHATERSWADRRFDAAQSDGLTLAQYDAIAAASAAVRTARGLNHFLHRQTDGGCIYSPLVHSAVLRARLNAADELHVLGPFQQPSSKPVLRRAAALALPLKIAMAPKGEHSRYGSKDARG